MIWTSWVDTGTHHRALGGTTAKRLVINVLQGIMQGDTLSTYLFVFVMELVSSQLLPEVNVEIDGACRSKFMLADDTALASVTKTGLQLQTNLFVRNLSLCGMKLNPTKCKTLRILGLGAEKSWVCSKEPFITLSRLKE